MRTRVEELFHAAADLSTESRERFLAEQELGPTVLREVEDLLAFDSRRTASLDRNIGHVALRALFSFEPQNPRCGPYQLGDLLGRGGMGAVYSAERVDGEIAHRVAVKLLRQGLDSPHLRHRFLAERQILASLSHPNIARLLDAGHREDGQPFLVMEYIDGKPIDQYAAGLNLRQKLTLFLKVCTAVSYLHQHLVVHRDLKPTNILVTGEGEPKLLDFGIAKMLDDSSDSTVTAMRMLTPDYASPEQVFGGPASVATDIYALGAVLYELLTGTTPHRLKAQSGEAGVFGPDAGKIVRPSKLAPGLKGDLELIVQKALRVEPQERYATVEKLSDDLENYLESRPIRARRGDAWYRTRKFLQRHWLPVGVGTLATVAMCSAMVVVNHERAIAQRRFVMVRQLANKLFDIDGEVRRTPGTTKARQLIVGTSLDYLRRVSEDLHGDPDLALELGQAYMRVARVQGVPIALNLGQMDEAGQNLQVAERLIGSVLAVQPGNRMALLRAAQVAHDRMLLARLNGKHDAALAFADKSAEFLGRFQAVAADKPEAYSILNTYLNVADQYALAKRHDDAILLSRRGIELSQLLDSPASVGTFLWVSAKVFRSRGDLDRALQDFQASSRILEPDAPNPEQSRLMNFALSLVFQAKALGEDNGISLGRSEEAAAMFERAFNLADTFVHQDPHDQVTRGRLAMAGLGLAGILRHSAPARSLEIYDHTLRHLAEITDNGSFRRFEVNALAGSTYPLRSLGRTAEARQRLDEAFARLRQTKDYPTEKVKPGSEADQALCALAEMEADTGNLAGAIAVYEKLLGQIAAANPKPEKELNDAVQVSRVYGALAKLRRQARRTDASDIAARRVELWRHWDAALPNNGFVRRQLSAAAQEVE